MYRTVDMMERREMNRYYEVRLNNEKEKDRFVKVVLKKKKERGLTWSQLAEMTKIPQRTLTNFVYCGFDRKHSRFTAAALANVLDIKRTDWSGFLPGGMKMNILLIGLLSIPIAMGTIKSQAHAGEPQAIDYSKYIETVDNTEDIFGIEPTTEENWIPELFDMELTYYTDHGTCYDGTEVHKGVCAVSKDLVGLTAIVYTYDETELIGIYECCDTGYGRTESYNGKGTIENGHCIDIYFDSDAEGKQFIKEHGNRVKVMFVRANG